MDHNALFDIFDIFTSKQCKDSNVIELCNFKSYGLNVLTSPLQSSRVASTRAEERLHWSRKCHALCQG